MRLLITAEMVPEDKALNYSFRSVSNSATARAISIPAATAAIRWRPKCRPTSCSSAAASIATAAGSRSSWRNADKSTLIRLDRIAHLAQQQAGRRGRSISSGGADDRVFRLDRANLDECRSLIDRPQRTRRHAARGRHGVAKQHGENPCIDAIFLPPRSPAPADCSRRPQSRAQARHAAAARQVEGGLSLVRSRQGQFRARQYPQPFRRRRRPGQGDDFAGRARAGAQGLSDAPSAPPISRAASANSPRAGSSSTPAATP